ncbi:MAG: hypothetical protein HKP61_02950 [Dactylosporangium sp.]|nr:hypothetical protein [Dactylosporangium sp.]NNJ59915.1 hypothetical protein [Dactylosporangium sp.]
MEAHHGWNRFIVTDMTGRLFVMGLPAGSVQERHSAKTALVSIRLGAPIRFVC